VDQLRIIWDAGVKKAVAEIAPYIVAIVTEIKNAIREAGGFEAIWKKITEALRTVVNVLLIIGTILAARVVIGAAAFAVQLGKALVTARGLSAVLARTPIGLLAVGAAILAEKFGVDLVGSAGDFLDINLDVAAAQKQIDDALAEQNAKLNGNTEQQKQLNEEQKKALETFNQTSIALQSQNQYLKDINAYGKQEANVRKLIRDEAEKLAKVGLKMTPQQEQMLRLLKEQEQIEQRITTLKTEQADAIIDSTMGLTSVTKAMEKYSNARLKMVEGLTDEEIKEYRRGQAAYLDAIIQAQTGESAVLVKARAEVSKAVDDQIGQYDRLTASKIKYQKDYAEIEGTLLGNELLAREGQGFLTLEQEKGLQNALLTLEREAAMQKMQIESDIFANFSQYEDMKIQRAAETHAEQLRMQKDFLGNQMFSNETIKQIAAERAAFEKKTDLERVQFGIDQGATLFAALGKENKKAFEASKALAVASALINTYQGATKALATYPFPFGLIAAAAAVAAGLAQVNAIKSQQYSGKMVGGAVAGAGSYLVGEKGPELFTPGVTGNITPNHQMGGGSTNVNFTIVANDTAGFDELLTSRRGVIQQIISDAMLERGQRM
jgi:hypothetical protein